MIRILCTRAACALVVLLMTGFVAHAQPSAPIIDADFSVLNKAVNTVTPDGSKQISGVLPKGWNETSAYQNGIKITYAPVEVDGRKGMRATKLAGGEIQFHFPLPDLKGDALYRVQIVARNPAQMNLSFSIRDLGPPYNAPWQAVNAFGDEWQTFSADFRLPKMTSPVGFYVSATGPNAAFDLASIRLTQRTEADILADLQKKYPDGGPKNLLRVTRFPLGLQSGWMAARETNLGETVLVDADAKNIGPSGAASLRLQAPSKSILDSAPFEVVRQLEMHTASLYLRGQGSGRLSVQRDQNGVAVLPFEIAPKDGWKRFEMPFKPGVGGKIWMVRVEWTGDISMDALQVEPGNVATPYASQMPFEVSLGLPSGDASLVRIQFEDENPTINYAITGTPPPLSMLDVRVVDAFGRKREFTVAGQRFLSKQAQIDYAAPSSLGPFRVEARLMDAEGRPLSAWNELIITRVHRPRYWGRDAPDSFFGGHMNPTYRNILLAKSLGVNWVRLHDAGLPLLGWAFVEPQRGVYKWDDAGLMRYRNRGISILADLETTPRWAAINGGAPDSYYGRYFVPADLNDWKAYVRTISTRYKGIIGAYDVWNEPWGGGYLNIGYDATKMGKAQMIKPAEAEQIARYLELQRAAYEVLKETDPTKPVLIDTTRSTWTDAAVAAGDIKAADVIGYHNYSGTRGTPGDGASKTLENKRAQLAKEVAPVQRPIWMTEGSPVPDKNFSGFYNYTLPYASSENPLQTADAVARYQLALLSNGVQKSFLYSLVGNRGFNATPQPWAVGVMEDGYPHPSGAAQAQVAWMLEDTRFVETKTLAEGVYAHIFEGKNRSVSAIVMAQKHAAYTLPTNANLRAFDLFGNPLANGSKVGETVVYLESKGGAAELQRALTP